MIKLFNTYIYILNNDKPTLIQLVEYGKLIVCYILLYSQLVQKKFCQFSFQ